MLLNRRGWSNFLTCRSCGRAWECPECDVTLVLHRARDLLTCHHCGHRDRVPSKCPDCGSVSIARHGTGTERMEADLQALGGDVFRLDGDAGDPAQVLARVRRGARAGSSSARRWSPRATTSPTSTSAWCVDADATLRFPDFRAEERTFALVTQLAGRAGRGRAGGRVLVQTLDPGADAIRFAARHDADGFLAAELGRREALRYPPFSTLIRVVCSSTAPGAALAAAGAVRERLPGALGPAPLFRLRGRERAQVVLKAGDRAAAVAQVGAAVDAVAGGKAHRQAAFSVDVDPQ